MATMELTFLIVSPRCLQFAQALQAQQLLLFHPPIEHVRLLQGEQNSSGPANNQ